MKNTFLPLTVLLTLALSACNMNVLSGSGNIINSNHPVSGFTRLAFDAPGELTITQGEKESLSMEGDDNLLEHIQTEVINGELRIYVTPEWTQLRPSKPIRYSLSIKNLEQVALNGSGKIIAAKLKGAQVAIKLNGSGEIDFGSLQSTSINFALNGSGNVSVTDLSADNIQASINGSGEYALKGKAAHQNISILGSGKYDARSLQSTRADISISGAGEGEIWAAEEVSVTILGSGNVGVVGKPKITQQISGSGNIYALK